MAGTKRLYSVVVEDISRRKPEDLPILLQTFNACHFKKLEGSQEAKLRLQKGPKGEVTLTTACGLQGLARKAKNEDLEYEYAMGIVNESDQTIRLVPLHSLYEIRPSTEISKRTVSNEQVREIVDPGGETKVQEVRNRRSAVEEMGAARVKRRMHMAVDERQIAEQFADSQFEAIKDNVMQNLEVAAPVMNTVNVNVGNDEIPPFNMETSKVHECYPLESLIGKPNLSTVQEWMDKIWTMYKSSPKAEHVLKDEGLVRSEIAINLIRRAGRLESKTADAKVTERRLMSAVYLDIIMALNDVFEDKKWYDVGDLDTISQDQGLPPDFVRHFAKLFLEDDSRIRVESKTKYRRGKASDRRFINYALVVWLTAVDFEAKVDEIDKALELEAKTRNKHFKALGCSVHKVQEKKVSHFVATLSAPLVFPELLPRAVRTK